MIFDQAQRYRVTASIVDSLRSEDELFSMLEVGANTHANLAEVLPEDQCLFIDKEIDASVRNDARFVLGDALNMSFADNQFDIVVSLDVLEHISVENRARFLEEQYRVASSAVILAAPFNFSEVRAAEGRCRLQYQAVTGTPHRWLEEHKLEGLPDFGETLRLARELAGGAVLEFSHGDLRVWEAMISAHACESFDSVLAADFSIINGLYEDSLCAEDYCQRGYRNFLILLKDSSRQSRLKTMQEVVAKKSDSGLMSPVRSLIHAHSTQLKRRFSERHEWRASDQAARSEINLLQNQVLQNEADIAHMRAFSDQLELQLDDLRQEVKRQGLQLEQGNEQLQRSSEELQRVDQELQRSNEELQRSREELQRSNEELQRSREELQGSREELQQSKEDLQHVEQEFQQLSKTRSELEVEYSAALLIVESMQHSVSWRLTAPVRFVSRLIKGDWASIVAAWSRQEK